MMDADDAPPMTREFIREVEASKRYAERERVALVQLAMATLADRSIGSAEHAIARKRLTGRDLADVDLEHLSEAEQATLVALLDKVIDGATGDVVLRVVAEARPLESIVTVCTICKARRDSDYINVADLDTRFARVKATPGVTVAEEPSPIEYPAPGGKGRIPVLFSAVWDPDGNFIELNKILGTPAGK